MSADASASAKPDAPETVDLVGAVTEVPDDGQRGGRGCFAVERGCGTLRQHAELIELRGKQGFVGRDHRLAGCERGPEDRLHLHSAGDFDNNVDFRIAHQLERIVGLRNA